MKGRWGRESMNIKINILLRVAMVESRSLTVSFNLLISFSRALIVV